MLRRMIGEHIDVRIVPGSELAASMPIPDKWSK